MRGCAATAIQGGTCRAGIALPGDVSARAEYPRSADIRSARNVANSPTKGVLGYRHAR